MRLRGVPLFLAALCALGAYVRTVHADDNPPEKDGQPSKGRRARNEPYILGPDVPALSHSYAPWNPVNWKNTVALCATMRDENVTDVMEWLNYYKCAPQLPPCARLWRAGRA